MMRRVAALGVVVLLAALALAAFPVRGALRSYAGAFHHHTGVHGSSSTDSAGLGNGFTFKPHLTSNTGTPGFVIAEPKVGSDFWNDEQTVLTKFTDPDGTDVKSPRFASASCVDGFMIVVADGPDVHIAFKEGYRAIRWVAISALGGAAVSDNILCSWDDSSAEEHRVAVYTTSSGAQQVQFLAYDKATDSFVTDGGWSNPGTLPGNCGNSFAAGFSLSGNVLAFGSLGSSVVDCNSVYHVVRSGPASWAIDASRTIVNNVERFPSAVAVRGDYTAVTSLEVDTVTGEGGWWLYHYTGGTQVLVASGVEKGVTTSTSYDPPTRNIQVSSDGTVVAMSAYQYASGGRGGLLVYAKGAGPATVNGGYAAVTFISSEDYEQSEGFNSALCGSTSQQWFFGEYLHMTADGSQILASTRRECHFVLSALF